MCIAVKVENLVKTYGSKCVLDQISFHVNKGEIFGFLGVNGAGKTTTLECIEGLRKYDSGSIDIQGKVGVQLQSSSLPANIKPLEAITLFSRWNKTTVDSKWVDYFGIYQMRNTHYKDLSTGQKRRVHLVLAMIGNPDIIILDEPTAGLDVEGRVSLHDEIKKLKNMGKTIILASHDMAEVETLCDRISILRDGKIAFMGTTQELTNVISISSKIYIKTDSSFSFQDLIHSKFEGEAQDYHIFSTYSISDTLLEILSIIKKQQCTVLDIKVERATLEQRFMDIAKEVQ